MTSEGERESAAAEIQLAEEELRVAERLAARGLVERIRGDLGGRGLSADGL